MSRRRVYSEQTLDIMRRFYAAFDVARENKLIKNTSYFCEHYGIDKRHFYAQRADLGRGYFEVSWLLPLIEDCGISPNWLLTGKGMMFRQ